MQRNFRLAAIAAVSVLAMQLVGCAQLSMGQPKPNIDTTAKLRGAQMSSASLGAFALEAGKPEGMDKSVSMRGGNSLNSPVNGSFAQYLRESLKVELEAAGLLDPQSPTVISGKLTRSDLDAAIGTGKGQLTARFQVQRADKVRYDRELGVESTWESSFIGGVAIPLAASNYEGLYRKLVAKLLEDTDFRKAVSRE